MIAQLGILVGLLAAVAALALLARKVKVPPSIVLVLAGLGFGWIPGLPQVRLAPDLFLMALLPPLIYPSAVLTPWRDFRANLRPICLLALGLVLFTMVGVGFIAHASIPGLPLTSAFVLGAIISPTDPIAATAIAQRMRVPSRIERVLEGESLVNDSTGLVGYRLAIAAVVAGSFSYGHAAWEFLEMAGGGIALGLAVGWLAVQIQRRIEDPPIETTISLVIPFAAYLPAEQAGVSGVLATVAAGLYVGWNSPLIHTAQTRLQAVPFWRTIQFILNGVVFLLIGLELPEILQGMRNTAALTLAWEGALISIAVIVIRILWVFPVAYLPRLLVPGLRKRDPFPDWRHVALVAWTGMRGAVSLAAALGLPHLTRAGRPFPGRGLIQFLTYSVILATLVFQGLSLPRLIRWLGIGGGVGIDQEEQHARLKTTQAVLDHLKELEGKESAEALEKMQAEYSSRVQQLETSADSEDQAQSAAAISAYQRLKHQALQIERDTLIQLRNKHDINDEVLRRIQHELDLEEDRLRGRSRGG